MTFEATPQNDGQPLIGLQDCESISVCDLTGVERFVVWAFRWTASVHDDVEFAMECLVESFDRAGLGNVLPAFRSYVATVHGAPTPCLPAARLGCWRLNPPEAHTLHALACLQSDRFGEAWRTLEETGHRFDTGRAMLALGELADALGGLGGWVRPWKDLATSPRARV